MLKLFSTKLQQASNRPLCALPTRNFSRADIIKNLDKSKVSRRQFVKKELTENPEFFKAFPHMQTIFNVKKEKEELDE